MKKKMELADILENIYQKISREITEAYFNDEIDIILEKYGLNNKISYSYYDRNNAKILVVGDSAIGKDLLLRIAKKFGITEKQIELQLDYEKLTNYNFSKLQNSMTYSDVLVGPIPHKVGGLDNFISKAESNPEEYPKLIKLEGSNEYKITKNTFTKALLETRLYNND